MGIFSSRPYDAPADVPSRHFPAFLDRLPGLKGKVVVVTGTTTGTGFVAALTCARKGAIVVCLNRPSARADAAVARIRDAASSSSDGEGGDVKVRSIDCDLRSFESVRSAAAAVRASFGTTGVDVLVNNAGVMALADLATSDGYDVQMQTNHLSHFLLVKELMPLLEKAAAAKGEARVVHHSSIARFGGPLRSEYFGKNGGRLGGDGNSMLLGGARWERYHQTKLANAAFTVELAARLAAAGSKVKAVVAAPGAASTNLQVTTYMNDGMPLASVFMSTFAQSAEDGSMPLLTCVAADGVENGAFYEPRGFLRCKGLPKRFTLERNARNEKARKMLWAESEKACGEFKLEGGAS